MKLESLKDLESLVKLCRKLGVEAMEVGDVRFNLGPLPKVKAKSKPISEVFPEANIMVPPYNGPTITEVIATNQAPEIIKTDELTEDQLLYYSVTDHVQDDKAQ